MLIFVLLQICLCSFTPAPTSFNPNKIIEVIGDHTITIFNKWILCGNRDDFKSTDIISMRLVKIHNISQNLEFKASIIYRDDINNIKFTTILTADYDEGKWNNYTKTNDCEKLVKYLFKNFKACSAHECSACSAHAQSGTNQLNIEVVRTSFDYIVPGVNNIITQQLITFGLLDTTEIQVKLESNSSDYAFKAKFCEYDGCKHSIQIYKSDYTQYYRQIKIKWNNCSNNNHERCTDVFKKIITFQHAILIDER